MRPKDLLLIISLVLALFMMVNGMGLVANALSSPTQDGCSQTCPQQGQYTCPNNDCSNYGIADCPRSCGAELI